MRRDEQMRQLFEPRSVAVIGASSNSRKVGYRVVENIVNGEYGGFVYPVNRKGGTILGHAVHKSISDIDDPVDLAVVTIPAKLVPGVAEECGAKGVKNLVVISSGFSEVGERELEQEIVTTARSHGMRVLGPNVFGLYSSNSSLDATFGPGGIRPGSVAIVTQSGALGIAMIGKTSSESLGLSSLISIGNKADINESDVLEYLRNDTSTEVILLYIEGVNDGDRLVEMLQQVTRKKHVIVIKSGRSKRGAMAAASHTGSLAGDDKVFDSIMKQCGVLRAESVREGFMWARFLADSPTPTGSDAAIITNGGGIGVLATDASEKYGVGLYDNEDALKEQFSSVMPDFGSPKNPIDLTGQAAAEDYKRALDVALADDNIDSVIALYCETALFDTDAFGSLLEEQYEQYRNVKPIVFSLFGGEKIDAIVVALRKKGVPVFSDVYESVSCLGTLYRRLRHAARRAKEDSGISLDYARVEEILATARADDRNFLLADEAQQVGEVLGIETPESQIANCLGEAVDAAKKIGYPVAMKVSSKDIIHKSDAGGVALSLEDEEEVIDAYQAIMRSCQQYKPYAVIKGVEVVEMVKPGVETIIGGRQDRSFGPTIMFGLGGIYVEVMKDVAFRAAPLSSVEAHEMIADIRSYPLLLGVRGEKRKDIDEIAEIAVKLGDLVENCRSMTDIEINPLVVYEHGNGTKAVDIRILFSSSKEVR